ncbi:hypothetical protein LJ655_06820 [Paraburkholderia sp. MMS20-SJTN17]|uniref:Uncharacterized protein n=1 Tax=Paraburkholderia translucens TaxID=2886945 RepID=A0ABS8KA28_9BURK|nr:hypothetical protein [Paraburkholderia sp. MMS20-SJTN17]MCC8401610.1 hypothetical protein [Paraburkholderia sp. MMS20-SJTN17]
MDRTDCTVAAANVSAALKDAFDAGATTSCCNAACMIGSRSERKQRQHRMHTTLGQMKRFEDDLAAADGGIV